MELTLYLLNIPKPDSIILSNIIPKLPYQLQNKISRYRHIHDQWRLILSDLLTRKILSQETHVAPGFVELEIDPHGKPFLKGMEREFNLAHANDYIFFVTDNTPVGVDIEYILPLDDLDNLVRACFSEREIQAYMTNNKEQRLEFFYEIWTLKESYIKALGKGVSHSLQSFSINISEQKISLEASDTQNDWYFKRYDLIDQYKAAVCASHCHFPERPQIISASEVLELL